MPALSGLRVAIVGAGVLGLSIAARCASDGAGVTVFDARELGENASGVAAGMLAPGLEAALERGHPGSGSLFLKAYEDWPGFLARLSLDAPPELSAGAFYIGSTAEVEELAIRLAAGGYRARLTTAAEAAQRQPGLGRRFEAALWTPQDGRIDPLGMLRALEQVVLARGGQIRRERLSPGPVRGFDAVVLALGYESHAWRGLAPEFAHLQPIKGHVLHFAGGPADGPVIRSAAGYAAPQRRGTIFGATMEEGRSDLKLDGAIVERLHAAASTLFPILAHTPFDARVGVRITTPDGAPLVGKSASGLFVATGARRNGWLLAPLVADAMAAALQGAPPRPEFDPARFHHAATLAHA